GGAALPARTPHRQRRRGAHAHRVRPLRRGGNDHARAPGGLLCVAHLEGAGNRRHVLGAARAGPADGRLLPAALPAAQEDGSGDRAAGGRGAAMTPKLNRSVPGKELKWRYVALGGAMLLGISILIVQLYRLQVVRGDEYAARSVANFVKVTRVLADRGMIKDRRGEVLVQNRPSFDVFVTPAFCQDCVDQVLPRLAELLEWTEEQREKA